MSSEIAIHVEQLSKCYQIYKHPRDRLKQFIVPKVRRCLGLSSPSYFQEFWALKDVTFDVRRGESVGILGRNGSGKSTLLQLITGTLSPTSGSIQTKGRVSALLELGAGFNLEFTGRENIYLNLALQGFSDTAIHGKFEDVVAFADIGPFIERPVKTYSSGMYARLAFAAAIHTEPDVLIVDEILAVGDAPFQQKCMNRLYRMLDNGLSLLMVSHDAYQVRSLCRRALLLSQGRQICFDSSEGVMNAYLSTYPEPSNSAASAQTPAQEGNASLPDHANTGQHQGFSVSISNPTVVVNGTQACHEIKSHSPVDIEFEYQIHGHYEEKLSFVINLYRNDDTYVFGTTTGMQGLAAFHPGSRGRGRVSIHFPSMPLVSGQYKFRVAVNDGRGLNILAEAVPVCQLTVVDNFQAVGIVDLPHTWTHQPRVNAGTENTCVES